MLPVITTSGIVSLIVAFLLGLLIGVLVRKVIAVGLILLAIVLILLAVGYITPNQIVTFLHTVSSQLPSILSKAEALKGIIPYDSIVFIIGFVIGIIKG